ncbi:hypothetical protein Cgig2_018750 [Carnegiea gigantea]|uniref:Uncharacterized protein n=1 Tax=Carnegiea gigantea TaxID=171969 RepID=A0A9Q1GFP2_9CARY|nr:hypothetical protein Cgig2_018750 [Carnegiea gigantea]
MGGNKILDHELEDLNNLLHTCELQEIRWTGAYFSWTNKTIWSRIDRALTNAYWFETSDFTLTHYLTNGLSDHTPMLIDTLAHQSPNLNSNSVTCGLNKDHFADLRAQQDKGRRELSNIQQALQHDQRNKNLLQEEKTARDRYVSIFSSSISLIQQ